MTGAACWPRRLVEWIERRGAHGDLRPWEAVSTLSGATGSGPVLQHHPRTERAAAAALTVPAAPPVRPGLDGEP